MELGFLFVYMIGLVISVSIHEFSHAYALYLFGDRSIRTRKRLSIRPDLHFKWWGYVMLLLTGVIVGNPVFIEQDEVDPKYNWYIVLIVTKLAGPLSNLVTAVITFFVLKYVNRYPNLDQVGFKELTFFLEIFAFVNLFLFVFNMIPIPLLDGGVFLLILGMILDIDVFVIIASIIGVIVLFVIFIMFPENSFLEFIMGILDRIMEGLELLIVGKGAF